MKKFEKYWYYDRYRNLMVQTYSDNKIRKSINRICALRKFITYACEWDRMLLERYKDYLTDGHVIKLFDGVKMYLPNISYQNNSFDGDYIQKNIFYTCRYYEEDELNKIRQYLTQQKVNICDIGANIGNHSLFFIQQIQANHVYCFEPVESTFDILKKNISLNKFENVKLYNMALGKSEGTGMVNVRDENNCGANQIVPDIDGKIKMTTLDNICFNERIHFVKIDVEGYEKDVLIGGKRFFAEHSPLIYVEIFEKNFVAVNSILKDYGYTMLERLGDNFFYGKI